MAITPSSPSSASFASPPVGAVHEDIQTEPRRSFAELLSDKKAATNHAGTAERSPGIPTSLLHGGVGGQSREERYSTPSAERQSLGLPIVAPLPSVAPDVPGSSRASLSPSASKVDNPPSRNSVDSIEPQRVRDAGPSTRSSSATSTPIEKEHTKTVNSSDADHRIASFASGTPEPATTASRGTDRAGRQTTKYQSHVVTKSAELVQQTWARGSLRLARTRRLASNGVDSRDVDRVNTVASSTPPESTHTSARSDAPPKRITAQSQSNFPAPTRTESVSVPLAWTSAVPDPLRVSLVTDAPTTASLTHANAGATASIDLPRFVGDVSRVLTAGGDYRVSLFLHPESLGSVRATVSLNGNDLHVSITPESHQAHDVISHELDALRNELSRGGMSVNVTLHDHGTPQGNRETNDSLEAETTRDPNDAPAGSQPVIDHGQIHVLL